ncbi:MAG TPA: hypothetical protein VFG79_19440, partial [Solirubrobacter sp.]|nr:hypothetical protein [Solirubrobacter sp.]
MALPRIDPLAAALTALGVAEMLLGPGDGNRAVSAVAVVACTLPLAWRRTRPLVPLFAIALALIAQVPLGGFLIGATVTPLIALAFALYACGRQLAGRWELAAAALGVVIVSATRIAVDPAAGEMGQAALTFVAVSLPLLVGRWVRGQGLLQRR